MSGKGLVTCMLVMPAMLDVSCCPCYGMRPQAAHLAASSDPQAASSIQLVTGPETQQRMSCVRAGI